MLESEEAARRLGVQLTTLYAYVSRGRLTSHRSGDGRRSLFDEEDIECMAQRARGDRQGGSRLATVTTRITQLSDEGVSYRGQPAVDLARSSSFEEVAALLWDEAEPTVGGWEPQAIGEAPDLSAFDRLRWAALLARSVDPLRSDRRPQGVTQAARDLIATLVDVLPQRSPQSVARSGAPIAERLAGRLSPNPTVQVVEAVNAALILLADHELATSTVAVRVAASTRADLYDAVLVGLSTLDGPLHGGASEMAYELLLSADREGIEVAIDRTLRWQGVLPGFGHTVYKHGDARCGVLLEHFDRLATPSQKETLYSLLELADRRSIPAPNVDTGLAALSYALGLPADSGKTIFSIARVAGWTAHYLEELSERPLRFRARAIYAVNG
jgi:citrate synthase